jgi:peptide-methionine (R)-S-oxide reductase
MMTRRRLLFCGASVVTLAALGGLGVGLASSEDGEEVFEITKTEEEWRAILTPEQYAVLREEATERPGSSPLLDEHRKGLFACAGCDLPLYSSDTKFDSGTGWPSFWAALEGAVATREDLSIFGRRTELHCRRCGGHLGHVFNDAPKTPTGMRHCINGLALVFHPAEAEGTG